MVSRCSRLAFVSVFWLILSEASALAQDEAKLPEWTAVESAAARLGEVFSDSRISIRPPRHLQRVDRPNPPEMTKLGVYTYGWTPEGVFPSIENLSVTLTPFAQPSSSALDKTVNGMKSSIEKGSFTNVQFSEVQKGRYGGLEARRGKYTAQISGEKLVVFYLVGIDSTGSFAVTTMLPESQASPEKIQEIKASILTFQRVK